jgi:hypothetical protein
VGWMKNNYRLGCEQWTQVRSELAIAINTAFAADKIALL